MEKGNVSSIQIRKKNENMPIRKKENIQIGKRKIPNIPNNNIRKKNIPIRKQVNIPSRKIRIFQLEIGNKSSR